MASFGPFNEMISRLELGQQYLIRNFQLHENKSNPTNACLQILLTYQSTIEAIHNPERITQKIVPFSQIPQIMGQYYSTTRLDNTRTTGVFKDIRAIPFRDLGKRIPYSR